MILFILTFSILTFLKWMGLLVAGVFAFFMIAAFLSAIGSKLTGKSFGLVTVPPELKPTYYESDLSRQDEVTSIVAGARYRLPMGFKYIGQGYLVPEPTNPHDPNAIAIYTSGGRHVGYWPRNDQQFLRSFRRKANAPDDALLPCFIKILPDGKFFNTYCRALVPLSEEYVSDRITGLTEWATSANTTERTITININR